MTDDSLIKKSIISQFLASLEMLRETIQKCPDEVWLDDSRKPGFWQVAYHALFYVHLYIQPSGADFKAWEKHRPDYQFLGALPWPPHNRPNIREPFTKADVLEYLDFCCDEIRTVVPGLDLAAGSGFDWLPMSKLELQFYSLRHLMQHTGELSERLNAQTGQEINWRSMSN